VSSSITSGKAVAISVPNGAGITTGQAVTIDTGTNTFNTGTSGTALGISSTGNFVDAATLVGITANTTTAGTIMNISGTALSTNGEALNIALGTAQGTEPTAGKAIRVALGNTATMGLYINTGATYPAGTIFEIDKNAIALLTVTDVGTRIGAASGTNAGTVIKAIEVGTCTEAVAAAIFTCTGATTSGLTMGNLAVTDAIALVAQVSAGGSCTPDLITAATSFRIRCSVAPANGIVFNVLIVRR